MTQQLEHWPIDRLIAYDRNPRKNDHAVDKVAAAIKEYGFRVPVVAKSDGLVVDGHLRLKAAKKLRLEAVPVLLADDLTDAQIKAFRLSVNRVAQEAQWDNDLLKIELQDLQADGFDLSLTGFEIGEIEGFLAEPTEGLTDPDEIPEPPADPVTVPGDVWLLGRHRIICGDTSDHGTVERILAGEDIDLIVTSPPYNQKIDGFKPSGMHKEHGWVKKVGALAYADSMPERDYQESQRELLSLWFGFMRDGASIFYNHKNRYRDKRVVSPMEWLPGPFAYRQEVIWRRPGSVTQNARMFLPCDERIYWLYKGDDFTFNDETEIKTWSSVWDIAPKANLSHAVAFPIELPERCIRAASMADDLIFEPYCGSGTTLIASEKTGRRCMGVEISPAYVDVAVKRWQDFTGQTAKLEGDGRTFAELEAERVTKAA